MNNLEGLFKLVIDFGYICANKDLNAKHNSHLLKSTNT
jgi:hypothetical protein